MKQTLTQEDINRSLIMTLTGLTQLEYELMILECANQWLETNIETDLAGVTTLITSSAFWTWWNRQWDARNKTLIWNSGWMHLHQPSNADFKANARELHNRIHSIHMLNIWPNNAVISASFKHLNL